MNDSLGIINGAISLSRERNIVHGSYERVSAIFHGDTHVKLINCINKFYYISDKENHNLFERLSDHIFYNPSLQLIKDKNFSTQRKIDDLRKVRESLEPLQKVLGGDIVSSAMIWTPKKMQDAFDESPWEVLVDIRPISFASKSTNPEMIPFLFDSSGVHYIGWQRKSLLPIIFNCAYSEIWQDSNDLSEKQDEDNNFTENERRALYMLINKLYQANKKAEKSLAIAEKEIKETLKSLKDLRNSNKEV